VNFILLAERTPSSGIHKNFILLAERTPSSGIQRKCRRMEFSPPTNESYNVVN